MRKSIDFNHFSEKLTSEEVSKLKRWYECYHKLYTCYKWKYKKYKKIKLYLNMSSVGLTALGAILAPLTNLATLSISGGGMLIQGYISNSNIQRNMKTCRFGYTSYEKVLTQLKSCLRGVPYDELVLLSDLKVIDDIVTDLCPPINGNSKKYDTI